jgi:hypothetical protein
MAFGRDGDTIDIFEYLLNRYDFENMEKKEDYLRGLEEATERMPENPIVFIMLKYAIKYGNKAMINRYLEEFQKIDWVNEKFVVENAFGDYEKGVFEYIVNLSLDDGNGYNKEQHQKSISWLNTLIDEYNIYKPSYISQLAIFREVELLKKYIAKDKNALLSQKNLLMGMMRYQNGDDYEYKSPSDDKLLYTFNYKQKERDEILQLLLENGYNFIEKEPESFATLLTGKIPFKGEYERYNYTIKVQSQAFWDMLEKYPNENDVSLFNLSLSWEQLQTLDRLGYFSNKKEALFEIMTNFKQNGYAYNEYDEIEIDTHEYKALKLIEDGIKLTPTKQKDILLKYTQYNMQAYSKEYCDNNTMINKIICEKMANKQTADLILKDCVDEDKSIYDIERLFENYVEIKKPLFIHIQEQLLANDKLKDLYAQHYLRSEEEIYEYLKQKKEYYTQKQKLYNGKMGMKHLGDYGQMGEALIESQNFEGLRGVIKFIKENNLRFKDESLNIDLDIIKKLMEQKAPKDVIEYMLTTLTEYTFYASYSGVDEKFLDNLINYELWDVANKTSKNVSLDCTDKYDKTPLHYACEKHDLEKIENYIKLGLSLTTTDRYGKNAIDSFLKTKPSEKDVKLIEFFEWLFKEFIAQGGKVLHKQKYIKPIKAKKFKPYHDIIDKMENYKAPLQEENEIELEEDEELIELTIYKTEKSIHYHRYSTTVMVPKKDLVLDDTDIISDYVEDWEYDSDWDSDEDIEYEVVK